MSESSRIFLNRCDFKVSFFFIRNIYTQHDLCKYHKSANKNTKNSNLKSRCWQKFLIMLPAACNSLRLHIDAHRFSLIYSRTKVLFFYVQLHYSRALVSVCEWPVSDYDHQSFFYVGNPFNMLALVGFYSVE